MYQWVSRALAGHAHRSTVAAPARPQRSTSRIVGDRGPPLGRSGAHPGSDPLPLETGRGNGHRGEDRSSVMVPLLYAFAEATRLRAQPLIKEIENLARRARIDPATPTERSPTAPEPNWGLIPREGEILALLVRGHTDREKSSTPPTDTRRRPPHSASHHEVDRAGRVEAEDDRRHWRPGRPHRPAGRPQASCHSQPSTAGSSQHNAAGYAGRDRCARTGQHPHSQSSNRRGVPSNPATSLPAQPVTTQSRSVLPPRRTRVEARRRQTAHGCFQVVTGTTPGIVVAIQSTICSCCQPRSCRSAR